MTAITTTAHALQIQWMIRRDMEAVLAIEAESFAVPWTEADFIRCLRSRATIGLVAHCGLAVAGFVIYELFKWRLHLHNLAVAADCRRRGVGRAMLAKLQAKLTAKRRRAITADVAEANLPSQHFFSACGFRARLPVIRARYHDGVDAVDAYRFVFSTPLLKEERRCSYCREGLERES